MCLPTHCRLLAEEHKGGREDSSLQLSREAVANLKKIRGDSDDGPVFSLALFAHVHVA